MSSASSIRRREYANVIRMLAIATQNPAYCSTVILLRNAIETGVNDYWRQCVGLGSMVIDSDRFGESAPYKALFERFDFSTRHIVGTVLASGGQ